MPPKRKFVEVVIPESFPPGLAELGFTRESEAAIIPPAEESEEASAAREAATAKQVRPCYPL